MYWQGSNRIGSDWIYIIESKRGGGKLNDGVQDWEIKNHQNIVRSAQQSGNERMAT